ncbi:MAG: DUF4870 domain-containing protein [Cocleimonas sp.]|nr:DUF4870 domain-containing protein [Cocleimonas sp.]
MNLDNQKWAAIIHASALLGLLLPMALVLGPLVVWFLKKNESEFLNEQGKAALNFQMGILGLSFISVLLTSIAGFFFLVSMLVFATGLVFASIAAYTLFIGKDYNYPFAIRFIK